MREQRTIVGSLSAHHHKGHVPIEFDVRAGTTRLYISFDVTPERATGALFDNLISLALEGPAGWRGARHNNPDRQIRIDASSATPGFQPGPIEPGPWRLWLDVFRLLGPDTVEFRVDISLSDESAAAAKPPTAPAAKPNRGRGRYRGDLHAHTLHSDGSWDVPDLLLYARHRQLDFVTLTDHNTASGVAELERLAGSDILAMGGVELTTHFGHALVLGTRTFEEWRAGSVPGLTMPDLAAARLQEGKTFVIAHPMSPGDPSCTGCRWEYDDMRPGPSALVEVWNGPWSDYNEEGLATYRGWLSDVWINTSRPLYITAGSDIHGPWDRECAFGFNLVEAESLTEVAILDAVSKGRNVLTSGPTLTITASGGTHHAGPGETLNSANAHLIASVANAPEGARLRLVQDGNVVAEAAAIDGLGVSVNAEHRSWIMAEVRDASGSMLALANPVLVDPGLAEKTLH